MMEDKHWVNIEKGVAVGLLIFCIIGLKNQFEHTESIEEIISNTANAKFVYLNVLGVVAAVLLFLQQKIGWILAVLTLATGTIVSVIFDASIIFMIYQMEVETHFKIMMLCMQVLSIIMLALLLKPQIRRKYRVSPFVLLFVLLFAVLFSVREILAFWDWAVVSPEV